MLSFQRIEGRQSSYCVVWPSAFFSSASFSDFRVALVLPTLLLEPQLVRAILLIFWQRSSHTRPRGWLAAYWYLRRTCTGPTSGGSRLHSELPTRYRRGSATQLSGCWGLVERRKQDPWLAPRELGDSTLQGALCAHASLYTQSNGRYRCLEKSCKKSEKMLLLLLISPSYGEASRDCGGAICCMEGERQMRWCKLKATRELYCKSGTGTTPDCRRG